MNVKVLLKCSVKGCPRTRKIDWDDNFPKGTVVVELRCPWHDNGDFDQEIYFDKEGNQLCDEPEGISKCLNMQSVF
jgi:hypothetical protein